MKACLTKGWWQVKFRVQVMAADQKVSFRLRPTLSRLQAMESHDGLPFQSDTGITNYFGHRHDIAGVAMLEQRCLFDTERLGGAEHDRRRNHAAHGDVLCFCDLQEPVGIHPKHLSNR